MYRGFCRGKNVAVKIPNKQHMSESELQSFRHEVEIMRRISLLLILLLFIISENVG